MDNPLLINIIVPYNCSFASDKTMKTMEEMMEKGVSIVVNPQGEMKVVMGDSMKDRSP